MGRRERASGKHKAEQTDGKKCEKCKLQKGVREFRVAQGRPSNECKACERIKCAHCGEQKNTSDFDATSVHHFFSDSQNVVCLVCAASGATPSSGKHKAENTDGKTCEKCTKKQGVREFRQVQKKRFAGHVRK